MPTTPFILLAAWCFYHSSKKFHDWLYNSKVFGPPLKDWDQRRAISKKSKLIALTPIVLSGTMIWINVANPWFAGGLSCILITVSIFILTRPD